MIKFSMSDTVNESSSKERADAKMAMASAAAKSSAGSTKDQKHRVSVTISDPQHTMVSKRGEKIEKRVRLNAKDEKHAQELAKQHFKKQGYKIHDTNYIGVVEEVNEISNALLQRYKEKAGAQIDNPLTPSKTKLKRGVGHLSATAKQMSSGKPMPPLKKEEIEQIDELGKSLYSYVKKAGDERDALNKHVAKGGEYADTAKKIIKKRETGISHAQDRLLRSALKRDYEISSKKGWSTEEVNMEEAMTDGDKSAIALRALTAKQNLKRIGDKHKSPALLKKLKDRVRAGEKLKSEEVDMTEDLTKVSTDKLKQIWNQHKDQERPSPTFAAHLKKIGKELQKRNALKEAPETYSQSPSSVPFTGGTKKTDVVTDKSGAKHTSKSRARHLAKFAMFQQMKQGKSK